MVDYTIPAVDSGLGIPAQTADTIGATPDAVFLSTHPAPVTFAEVVAASQTLAAWTVVGKDANGRLVKSTWHATTPIVPIGVLAEAVTTDSSTNYKGALVYKTGHFNFDRLVWDSSYDTDAKKLAAIRALEPNIKVGDKKTYTP